MPTYEVFDEDTTLTVRDENDNLVAEYYKDQEYLDIYYQYPKADPIVNVVAKHLRISPDRIEVVYSTRGFDVFG